MFPGNPRLSISFPIILSLGTRDLESRGISEDEKFLLGRFSVRKVKLLEEEVVGALLVLLLSLSCLFQPGIGLQALLSTLGSKPSLHLQPPEGRVQFPSPLQMSLGGESSKGEELATQAPLTVTKLVNSCPVGVSGKTASPLTTRLHTMKYILMEMRERQAP